jgi:hypothetical protein
MPYSELFWVNFLEVFPKALGGALGVLPAILGFWGGLILLIHVLNRWEEARRARREAEYGLGSRVTALEGRLLRFDDARRPRGESGGRDA